MINYKNLENTRKAKNAKQKGLQPKTWVKTSLAPGSKVVMEYLKKSNLINSLNFFGFHLVGYGLVGSF